MYAGAAQYQWAQQKPFAFALVMFICSNGKKTLPAYQSQIVPKVQKNNKNKIGAIHEHLHDFNALFSSA